jgi:acylphosphatase
MKKQQLRHYNILVKGKVQRVAFRVWVQATAQKLQLTGLVRNLHNGDVYIEVEGEEDNINTLIDLCYVGSPLSKVTEVNAEEQPLKNMETFELKR